MYWRAVVHCLEQTAPYLDKTKVDVGGIIRTLPVDPRIMVVDDAVFAAVKLYMSCLTIGITMFGIESAGLRWGSSPRCRAVTDIDIPSCAGHVTANRRASQRYL